MTVSEIVTLGLELVSEAASVIQSAYAANAQELEALGASVRDALASLRGERTQAHAASDARTAALVEELTALKASQSGGA